MANTKELSRRSGGVGSNGNGIVASRSRLGVTGLGDLPLGELLLLNGVITEDDLVTALEVQKRLPEYKPLGQLLVANKAISRQRLQRFLARYSKSLRLGDVLVRCGIISDRQLTLAVAYQADKDIRLGDAVVRLNLASEEDIRRALCVQHGVSFVHLDDLIVDRSAARLINKGYASQHRVVPVASDGRSLTVAVDDPANTALVEELRATTGCDVAVVSSTHGAFTRVFNRVYGGGGGGAADEPVWNAHRLELISDHVPPERSVVGYTVEARQAEDAVRDLLGMAMDLRASDIHLETLDSRLQVRYRVDGLLRDLTVSSVEELVNRNRLEIISRIKILGNLDIAERRRPQDGSFRVRIVAAGSQMTKVNIRVSVIPGYYGENVVLRILDPRNAPASIDSLGFSSPVSARLRGLLQRSSGILLITGPTGCGKSTTMYASLMTMYRPGIKILTAEDPIEYVYENLSQSEVNERIGNGFASYLRAFLRHDPEVIMVGEIRDIETAEMAFRAAQTGHLLLSTLHTNDAVSSVARLLDLGVDRNVVASSLLGVLSQRLIRTNCPLCTEPYDPPRELLAEFFDEAPDAVQWSRGRGCAHCDFTGYKGRTPVGELWVPTERDVTLINKGAPVEEVRASADAGTVLMGEDVSERLFLGKTTLDELMRMLPYASVRQFRLLRGRTPSAWRAAAAPVPA
jgi:type IV pilus assembly protein PilB